MRLADPQETRDDREAFLRCEGEYWTIAFDGRLVRLRDRRGLRYLEVLLRHPGRPFHVTELLALVAKPEEPVRLDDGGEVERTRKAVTNRIRDTIVHIRAGHETLGLYLGNTVHTGTRCTYTPERPLTWES